MPEVNVKEALEFILWLGNSNVSIYTLPHKGGSPQLRKFKPEILKLILEEYHNTYYSLANVKPGIYEKAEKEELLSTRFLHVDLDPWDGHNPADELTRLVDSLQDKRPKEVPPPSAVIASGRGVQALWRLKHPVALPEGIEAVELANKWLLECLIGPPGTHNVDRILRLPGSWNCLDPKKLAKGYTPQLVKTIELNDNAYELTDFGKWEPSQAKTPSTSVPTNKPTNYRTDDITAEIIKVKDLSYLNDYEKDKSKPKLLRIRWLISNGAPLTNLQDYEDLHGKVEGRKPNDRSAWVYDVACNLVRAGVPDGAILGFLTDPEWPISAHCRDQADPEHAARRQLARAKNTVAQDKPKEETNNDGKKKKRKAKEDGESDTPPPMEYASWVLDERKRRLIRVNSVWMTLAHHAFRPLEDEAVRKEIYDKFDFFDARAVSRVYDALRAHPDVYRDKADFSSPCWLDGRISPDPLSLIVVKNGMVDINTGALKPYDNQFYTTCQLSFDFDPKAPPPKRWLSFLDSVWPGDSESIECLQMWFGYVLTQDTSLQKMLNIVGPKRSGKGTIARVLGELVGKANRCGPSLNDLGKDEFALWSWIGKQLAIVSEVRLGKKTDREVIMERLLQIIGEDFLSVRRKGIDNWEGKLNTRIMVLSNSVLNLQDEAGAFVSRLIVLATTNVFEGDKQDIHLMDDLRKEFPGILLWALEGLRKLKAAGKISQPKSGLAMLEETIEATTPAQHPWEDVMAGLIGNRWGKLPMCEAWLMLGGGGNKDRTASHKLTEAMKTLGWKKTRLRYNGSPQYCYIKDLNEEGMPHIDAVQGRWIVASKVSQDNRYVALYAGESESEKQAEGAF